MPQRTPFAGDNILEVFEPPKSGKLGKICRFWYFVDEEARAVNIVNVYHQDFGWM